MSANDDPIETPDLPPAPAPDPAPAEPQPPTHPYPGTPAPPETPESGPHEAPTGNVPVEDPAGDPGGDVLEMLKIELRRDGRVNLSGPLKDKGVCYLMLELARDAIRDFEMRQMMEEAQKRAQGIVGASEIPPGLDGMGPRGLAMPPGFRPVPRGFRGRG